MQISRKLSWTSYGLILLTFAASTVCGEAQQTGSAPSNPKAPVSMKRTEVLAKEEAAKKKLANKKVASVKTIEVTGSRIKVQKADSKSIMHGASQVEVIDQTRIRRTGRADLLGVLSNMPGTR